MTANDQTVGGFEINSTERYRIKSRKRGKEQRVRRWQRLRKKRQTVISLTPTKQRVVVPPEVLHDMRICIEDLVDIQREEEEHDIDQWSEECSWASSVETQTPESCDVSPNSGIGDLARCLPTDLSSSYSSDGSHVVRVVPCAPNVPYAPKENRSRTRLSGLRPAEMRRRKYFVDSGLRQAPCHTRAATQTAPSKIKRKCSWKSRFNSFPSGSCGPGDGAPWTAIELVAIHDTIELRRDDDSLELFEEPLSSPTLSSVDVKGLFDQIDELNQEIQATVFV